MIDTDMVEVIARIERCVAKGILAETTGRKRNRRFAYKKYLALFPN